MPPAPNFNVSIYSRQGMPKKIEKIVWSFNLFNGADLLNDDVKLSNFDQS